MAFQPGSFETGFERLVFIDPQRMFDQDGFQGLRSHFLRLEARRCFVATSTDTCNEPVHPISGAFVTELPDAFCVVHVL